MAGRRAAMWGVSCAVWLLAAPAFAEGAQSELERNLALYEDLLAASDLITRACRTAITTIAQEQLADEPFLFSMGDPPLLIPRVDGIDVGDRAVFFSVQLLQGSDRHRAFLQCGLDVEARRVTWVEVYFYQGRDDPGPVAAPMEEIGGIPIEDVPIIGPIRKGNFGGTVEDDPKTHF